jgi:NodT family efflux transporter outer membrane factor (OMF) lipoprotein
MKFFVLSLFFLLSACTPHARQTAEPLPLPDTFVAGQPLAAVDLGGRWWESFADTGLNRLMEQLFSANLDLVQGHARLRQAEMLARQSGASSYPSLFLDGQAAHSSQPGPRGDSRGESAQLSLTAGYELDLFGKLDARSRGALLNYQASREDLHSLYMSLSAQLAELYFQALEQRAQLALADATIVTYTDSLNRVEDRYRQGLVPSLDLYQARQNLAAAQAVRQNYVQGISAAENALSVLIGDYPGQLSFPPQTPMPAAPPALPVGLPAGLLQNRPDLRAAFMRIEAADAQVAAAIADRFPSFNLSAGYGVSRSDLTGTLIRGDFWNLLIRLSQPLFDAGRRKNEVARNQAVFAEKVAEYQQKVLRAFQEVADALAANQSLEQKIERLVEQERASAAASRLSLQRYLGGLSDYQPVLSSQIFHFNVRSQQLLARRQLLSQRISLARALGGQWMAEALNNNSYQQEQRHGKD